MDNITGSISNNGQYSFVIVGEHKFIPENLYLELQQQNKELQRKLDMAKRIVQDYLYDIGNESTQLTNAHKFLNELKE